MGGNGRCFKFNKTAILLLIGVMFLSVSTQTFAEKTPGSELSNNIQTELTDEVILSLTGDDLEELYIILVDYKESNPDATEEDLDEIATEFYIETYNKNKDIVRPFGWYDNLLESATGMNSQEVALSKQYPSDLAAVYSTSKMANAESGRRYNSGALLGNQDAFRHTAWNALLVQRFYRLGKGNVTQVMAKTKMWTDAHEDGATNPGFSSSQWAQDKSMDLLNNAAGRYIGETYYDTAESLILERVQYYIDNGFCQKIKTNSQMEYTFEQMKAIPTWNLSATNTTGKK